MRGELPVPTAPPRHDHRSLSSFPLSSRWSRWIQSPSSLLKFFPERTALPVYLTRNSSWSTVLKFNAIWTFVKGWLITVDFNPVKPVLKDWPLAIKSFRNGASQDRWSLVTGSVTHCNVGPSVKTVWSFTTGGLMAVVSFHCSFFCW